MARIADAEVSDLLTNTVPQSGTLSGPLYTGFYLLEDGAGSQSLAVVGTALPFQTLPVTDTVLSVASLSGALGRQGDLVLTPVLTNSQSIIDVSVSPDGSQVAYLTEQAGALWAAGIDGLNHTEIITGGLSTNANLVWSSGNDALAAMSSGQPSLQVVDLSGAALGSLSVVSSEALNAEPLGAHVVRNYNVPFIHQLWDTPNWFGGYCACGPTSTAMSLAFYDKLSPHRITISSPYHHTNDYGFYVAEKFGSFRSRSVLECPGSQRAFGLYGYTMDYGRFAWAWRMQRAIERFGIRTTFDGSATLNEIKAALNRGHLVILSTRLTGAGHVVLVRGYTSDNRLIVNDPYGNRFASTYGKSVIDGANERYAWNRIGAKWFIEVHGTPPGGDQPNITHWRGAYYNNRTLSGRPSVVRNDTRIDFDWGSGAPASGISSDNFSVRWRRTMRFERGVYRFRVISDDGARLYVDGRRILNVWWDQPPTNYYADVYLRSGNHTIRLDYYEHGGVARSKLWWSRIGSSPSWSAEYYNNRNLSGGPTFTRNERSIYHNWRDGGPGNGVGNDNFSVRWRGNIWTPGGAVRFFTRTDDGVRLWVDGNRHISRWRDQARTTVFRSRRLSRGTHSVRMDYYEHLGVAYARMWYQPVFYVQYYNNRHLSGSPSWRGYNSRINYVWGYGSPNSQIRNYNFSARWTANQYFSGGRYRFCTRTDDGVRLYIDGVRVINRWQDQATRTYCTSRTLSRGHHHIRMEYYEHYGWARARLRWRRYGSTSTSGALTRGEEPPADADVLALYGDAGLLGPLTEADVGAEGEEVVHMTFLPIALSR
jgi:hypothetical protein